MSGEEFYCPRVVGRFYVTHYYLSEGEKLYTEDNRLKPVFIIRGSEDDRRVHVGEVPEGLTENDIYAGILTGRFSEVEEQE